MSTQGSLMTGPQLVELKRSTRGKQPKRVKAKHIATSTRRRIVELFDIHESFDDVAQLMDMSGVSGKTISEVVALAILRMRRPPAAEQGLKVMTAGHAA